MKAIYWLTLISFLALLMAPVATVQADGGSPWSEILNPDGTIQWSKLVDLGNSGEPASWMDVTLPGGMVVHQNATFHRYQTPSGNVLILPEPVTLFFMAMHPQESGLNKAQSMLGDGASILMLLVGKSLSPQQLADIASHGYTDPRQFFQAVIDGKENIWSFINLNFLHEVIKMSRDSHFLVNALLLYLNGSADCAQIPGGCTGLALKCAAGDCGLPKPQSCPVPSIAQGRPQLVIQKTAPQKPLVVGQDPAQRGADVGASVRIPPVIFTWYEEKQESVCHYTNEGNGGGCSGPGSQYGDVVNSSGQSIGWDASMIGNPSWTAGNKIICVKHVETLAEPIKEVRASANLNPDSRNWIVSDLASKYYGATIHHPNFNLLPGMGGVTLGCDGGKVCFANGKVIGIPFADPGTFDLELWAWTSGTVFNYKGIPIPITSPRVLYKKDALQVYVTLVTLLFPGRCAVNELDTIGQLLGDLPIYLANGILILVYWLGVHTPALVSLLCAALIALLPDNEIQERAAFRPTRSGDGNSNGRIPPTAQIMTAMVFVTWLAGQWDMSAPVPWIGAAMWAAGLLAVLALSNQRFNLLWYVKAGIAVYALAVIGSRIYLSYTAQLTSEQWAALIGSSENAATVIANTRGSVTTILLWALWLVVPLGYFSMLVQQIFINPMSIVSPLAGAQEILHALRVRNSQ